MTKHLSWNSFKRGRVYFGLQFETILFIMDDMVAGWKVMVMMTEEAGW